MDPLRRDAEDLQNILQQLPNNQNCFVIAPIGEPGSATRTRSDQVFKHIIKPVCRSCALKPTRADRLAEAGNITQQIVKRIILDRWVIADLTGHNPNVFYELAIRHAIRRPCIQLIQSGERLPFDVSVVRTISVDLRDPDSLQEAKKTITRIIRDTSPEAQIDSPISIAVGVTMLESVRTFHGDIEDLKYVLKDIGATLRSFMSKSIGPYPDSG